MTKTSVCIIGAGPAGLVSAKVLLQTGRFNVKVFEKCSRIGGIWALDEQSRDGFLNPQTPTNLSRFTVAFSDLAWGSVDVRSREHDGHHKQELPLFLRAWQVNRYLEEYRRRYIPEDIIQCNTEVTQAEREQKNDSNGLWTITVKGHNHDELQYRFDHVIMASGFFARARPIQQNIPNVDAQEIAIIHSSHFRTLQDLYPNKQAITGKIVLIVGGGNSAGEAAGVVAGQLSSAQQSVDKELRERYKDVRILHVTPRALYALPPLLPADESGHRFMPLDFSFYNLAKRLPGPVVAGAGISSQEIRDMLHAGIQTSIGSDQSDLGSAGLVSPNGESKGAVQVALSETYAEFVRSGLVEVVQGRVVSIKGSSKQEASIVVEGLGAQRTVEGIGAVLYATGYSPIPALDLLDHKTKEKLNYDRESMRLPLILEQWQTMNDAVPDVAFHGFYEGPYWGVMEMQARLTAARWLGDNQVESKAYETRQTMLELRLAMHEKRAEVPQYWLGDYGGYMEEMAAALHLKRNDGPFKEREGPVSPARYLSKGDNAEQAELSMRDLGQTWTECMAGKYAARAAIRALQGQWKMSRRIHSLNDVLPSGTVDGIATFHPRAPTKDKSELSFDVEYLYIESGTFRTTSGAEMTVSRRYVYRYSEARDQLSVWFVKPESPYEVDYLFHDLSLAADDDLAAIVAKADHLCVADMYRTQYRLPIKGVILPQFSIEHAVEGPQKSYTANTLYERPVKHGSA